jgi:aldehyde:ferredoxin oxidoreductase
MFGWNGKILRVNLSKNKTKIEEYDSDLALNFLGGRGFSIKILWDELRPGIDPLTPENKLIFAAGPLTGLALPSSGKLVVASKSPLTGGYGDGNIGSRAAVELRKAGYDALVLEGKAEKSSYLLIEDEKINVIDARDFWGLGTFEVEEKLKKIHGRNTGILLIGPAGENLVKYATIVSQGGRSGGRPGMGAVMGSKKIKAIVLNGSKEVQVANPNKLKLLGKEGCDSILQKTNFDFWNRQGTMFVVQWSQENSVLPTFNFKEGVFDEADGINGDAMEKIKTSQKGCPGCNMICGNIVEDENNRSAELDYENVAMLGSNIGLGNLKQVAVLNRLADDYGLDTISLGNSIGFVMEASEKKITDYTFNWGDFDAAKNLTESIVYRSGIGNLLANGVKYAAKKLGKDTAGWSMHVKGLEITGYDCHSTPGMALSFGTSPIGAHHKDAWVISWEVSVGRNSYSEAKVDKVIELQRIRGGIFESLVTCRLPWIELGFELDWYPQFIKSATGIEMTKEKLLVIADRIYSMIRAFWIREYAHKWNRGKDYPPIRWFSEPLSKGPHKGMKLNMEKYDLLLTLYYKKRGWDYRGIPKRSTLNKLGLEYVAKELDQTIELTP